MKNLDVKSNIYGFVCLNGAIWKPSKITDLMRDFIKLNKLNTLDYAPYSIRIGATSLCNQQEIDLLKLLKYVAYSISNLPHVQNRYIEFTLQELRIIPFEMLHGTFWF